MLVLALLGTMSLPWMAVAPGEVWPARWRASGPDDALTVGFTRRRGQQTIEQLVDGHGVENLAVRNLLIGYLRERSPALDHASTRQLALRL